MTNSITSILEKKVYDRKLWKEEKSQNIIVYWFYFDKSLWQEIICKYFVQISLDLLLIFYYDFWWESRYGRNSRTFESMTDFTTLILVGKVYGRSSRTFESMIDFTTLILVGKVYGRNSRTFESMTNFTTLALVEKVYGRSSRTFGSMTDFTTLVLVGKVYGRSSRTFVSMTDFNTLIQCLFTAGG